MVKFCLKNRFGIPYAIYECMCKDCNWMGEFTALVPDDWGDPRCCPECGCDDIDEFEDGIYENYITMPTEWKFRQTESWLLICKLIWKKIRRQK